MGDVNPNKLAAAEKKTLFARLKAYRADHGLGCIQPIVDAAGETVTDGNVRDMLDGNPCPIALWRAVGAALDKLEVEEKKV